MQQSRKKFLKHLVIGMSSVPFLLSACRKDNGMEEESGSTDSGACTVSPTETAGPFPTISPGSLVRKDIRDDRTGVPITINITVQNRNANCTALSGVLVDIWHCDKDGYYSEYGGSNMQSVNYSGVHFLRGRQITNQNGLVEFTSIFPGWYQGRATHIHVHIYTSGGQSLLVTQIAFPEGTGSAVATINGSGGTAYGYTKGMSGYTYNATDGIFRDDTTGKELAAVSGTISEGYSLTHTIIVAA